MQSEGEDKDTWRHTVPGSSYVLSCCLFFIFNQISDSSQKTSPDIGSAQMIDFNSFISPSSHFRAPSTLSFSCFRSPFLPSFVTFFLSLKSNQVCIAAPLSPPSELTAPGSKSPHLPAQRPLWLILLRFKASSSHILKPCRL